MFDKLHAKLTKQKLHDFDLDNPEDVPFHKYLFHRYHCKNCNKTLMLDHEQMLDLPWEMKIGCK